MNPDDSQPPCLSLVMALWCMVMCALMSQASARQGLLQDHSFDAYRENAPGVWEIRFGHKGGNYPNVCPNWRCISRATDEPEAQDRYLSIEKVRPAAGAILIGQRIALPNELPPLDLAIRYQAYCSGDDRSGMVALCVFSPEVWDGLSRDRTTATNTVARGDIFQDVVHPQGEDVTTWRMARTGGTALWGALRRNAGKDVIVAVSFVTWHEGNDEWARLDDLWLGDPLPYIEAREWPRFIYEEEPLTLEVAASSDDPTTRFVLEYRTADEEIPWVQLPLLNSTAGLYSATIPGTAARSRLEARARASEGRDAGLQTGTRTMELTERPTHPSLFFSVEELNRMREKIVIYDWAKRTFDGMKAQADSWLKRTFTPEVISGWWWHHYGCSACGGRLSMEGPRRHVCRSCSKVWDTDTLFHVYWSKVHGDHANAARNLALTYQITGDETYARRAIEILTWYADHYAEFPMADKGGKVVSQTLDECVWLLKVIEAADLAYPAMTRDEALHIERDLIYAGALYTRKYRGGIHNIRCWHNSCWAAAGYFVGDPELVAFARDDKHGFVAQMEKGVLEDGMWYERSMGYHSYTVSAISGQLKAAMHAGDDLYRMPQVRKLLLFPLLIAFPNLVPPSLNDGGFSTRAISPSRLELAAAWYEDPIAVSALKKRYAMGATRGGTDAWQFGEALPESNAFVPPPSMDLKGAGLAVLRRGVGDEAICAMLEYGEHGGGHGHPDKLQLILFGHGRQLCPDLGTTGYANPLHPRYYKTTPAHNTVTIGGKNMAGRNGRLLDFTTNGRYSAAVGTTESVYPGFVLTRRLLLGDGFLVDEFVIEGDKSDTIDWFLRADGALSLKGDAEPVTEKALSAPYTYLKNLRGRVTPDSWSAAWRFGKTGADSPCARLVVTMQGEPNTEVIQSDAPGGARLAQHWGTLRVRRRSSGTRFVAVHQLVGAGKQKEHVAFEGRTIRVGGHVVDLGSDDTVVPMLAE